ncbi:MAG TPA: cysteine-rich CWC family protein [Pseudoduganella sp.]
MSTCERCGATFHCAMADPEAGSTAGKGDGAPCWCTLLPPAVPVPRQDTATAAATRAVGCWCPACLKAHIAGLRRQGG